MVLFDLDAVESKKAQGIPKQPQQYVLVLNTMPNAGGLDLWALLVHLLQDHIGMPSAQADALAQRAIAEQRAEIMPCTKDVGETKIAEIHGCALHDGEDYRFTLEVR